jgi:hypothetical protein
MTHPNPPEPVAGARPSPAVKPQAVPPAPARLRRRRWPIIILGTLAALVFLLVFFIASTEVLHYTESTAFCSLCHVMKPEYTAYHNSPHARAECGTCHIGPGAIPAIQAKLANVRYVWVYPTNTYERPIPSPIHSLRPVEVVCEQCHWPQKFYGERLVTLNQFAQDEENTLTQTVMAIRTGGGQPAEGQGRGIHWHIANPVYYIATDEKRQDIPWVQAEFNGVVTEYLSTDSDLTPEALSQLEKRQMDCVDCHNRASHDFRRPTEMVDEALASGLLPSDLPNLKAQAVAVLEKQYATEEEAAQAIAAVEDYYANSYGNLYAARQQEVSDAVATLQNIFDRTQFPFMNVTWESHPNNIGHKDFPGCFRCHDGKHLSSDNQAIRLECNICHSIPQVAGPGQPAPVVGPKPLNEPESHMSTTWLAEHRFQFDETCAACHTVTNPGGSDNSSFCSNSACHATEWQFADLNAPEIRALSEPPRVPSSGVAEPVPHPIGATTDCALCHAADKVYPWPDNHASFTMTMCTQCHTAEVQEGEQPPPGAPRIPHQLEGMGECTMCHSENPPPGFTAMPPSHATFSVDICQSCHQPEEAEAGGEEAVEPTPEPPAPAEGEPAAQPPAIPHELEGRENCLMCHDPEGQVKPAPADHVGRAVETCQMCHQPEG